MKPFPLSNQAKHEGRKAHFKLSITNRKATQSLLLPVERLTPAFWSLSKLLSL